MTESMETRLNSSGTSSQDSLRLQLCGEVTDLLSRLREEPETFTDCKGNEEECVADARIFLKERSNPSKVVRNKTEFMAELMHHLVRPGHIPREAAKARATLHAKVEAHLNLKVCSFASEDGTIASPQTIVPNLVSKNHQSGPNVRSNQLRTSVLLFASGCWENYTVPVSSTTPRQASAVQRGHQSRVDGHLCATKQWQNRLRQFPTVQHRGRAEQPSPCP